MQILKTLVARYGKSLDDYMHQMMDDFIPTEPEFDVMLRYAMGWVQKDGSSYDHPTGKRLRPYLTMLCAEATNGDIEDVLPVASAVEYIHNFSLIHDDIQDQSEIRHGRPTVWQEWGIANAINAGDAMFALAYSCIGMLNQNDIDKDITLEAVNIFNRTNIELTRGQHLDMRFETQSTVTVDEYVSMIAGKSAALLAACAQMGALIGSQDKDIAQKFYDFGLNLGIAFQIHDDILGIWGDAEITGKSVASDIISKKKSLPVLFGLAQSDALKTHYEKPSFDDGDVSEAIHLLDEVDALAYTKSLEEKYHNKAMVAIESLTLNEEALQTLNAFVAFLFQREH